MDKYEQLAFAKERALEYLPDVTNATNSFLSDLAKHEDLRDHPVIMLIGMHMASGLLNERTLRDLITGTNA